MQQIQLSQGYATLVDDGDYAVLIAAGTWRYNASGYAVIYTHDSTGKRCTIYLHRAVMERVLGHLVGRFQVDHINANRLDNRRENLRLAKPSENQAHKGNQINSTSGQKGVRLRAGKWDVRIRFYYKRLCLGRYDNFDLAVAVYGYAHRALWGEFTTEGQGDEKPLPQDIQDKLNEQIAKARDSP